MNLNYKIKMEEFQGNIYGVSYGKNSVAYRENVDLGEGRGTKNFVILYREGEEPIMAEIEEDSTEDFKKVFESLYKSLEDMFIKKMKK